MLMFPWLNYANSAPYQNKTALRDDLQGEVFTWSQLAQRIEQTRLSLQRQGLSMGQGIALCGKNSMDLLCFYLAGLQFGLRVLGINPAFPVEKINRLCELNDISLRIDFSSSQYHCRGLKNSAKNDRTFTLTEGYTMTLTSGSTGLPKAVVHSVNAHLANAVGVSELMRFGANDSWLLSLPLYHVSGQGILWRWLQQGGELVLPQADFYASVIGVSHVSLVPTQLQRLLSYLAEHPNKFVCTKHILLGGSQIPLELTRQANRLDIQCYSGYGMTEMGSTVFAKESDETAGVGLPLKGREYRLVDDEIWLKGAGLAEGYWIDQKIRPLTNKQGWFQTKDKGQWLNNELVLLGRLDNMFISGGENIQPEEIENIIQGYELVNQVFILPRDDAEFGQRPVAMIQFNLDADTENNFKSAVEKLKIWLSDKIERFKQPVAYFPLDVEKARQEGTIKISRNLLKTELMTLLGK